jgi:hypothetical protein
MAGNPKARCLPTFRGPSRCESGYELRIHDRVPASFLASSSSLARSPRPRPRTRSSSARSPCEAAVHLVPAARRGDLRLEAGGAAVPPHWQAVQPGAAQIVAVQAPAAQTDGRPVPGFKLPQDFQLRGSESVRSLHVRLAGAASPAAARGICPNSSPTAAITNFTCRVPGTHGQLDSDGRSLRPRRRRRASVQRQAHPADPHGLLVVYLVPYRDRSRYHVQVVHNVPVALSVPVVHSVHVQSAVSDATGLVPRFKNDGTSDSSDSAESRSESCSVASPGSRRLAWSESESCSCRQ